MFPLVFTQHQSGEQWAVANQDHWGRQLDTCVTLLLSIIMNWNSPYFILIQLFATYAYI